MIQTYHQGRFKFFVAVIVIAIIALAGLGRYALMAEDARVLRLEIISHHFMTGAANARIQYLVNGLTNKKNEQEPFELAGQLLFFRSRVGLYQPLVRLAKITSQGIKTVTTYGNYFYKILPPLHWEK